MPKSKSQSRSAQEGSSHRPGEASLLFLLKDKVDEVDYKD